jgi:hypothetical protein
MTKFEPKSTPESGTPATWSKIPYAMLCDTRVTEGCIKVYGLLWYTRWAFHADRRSTFGIGQRLISRHLGLSTTTVGSAVKKLIEFGYLKKTVVPGHRAQYWFPE